MNRTPSGAIAVGAPHSLARINEECANAIENSYHLLMLTSEGRYVLERFAKTIGCDFIQMLRFEEDEPRPGHIAEWIEKNSNELRIFMRGLMERWVTIQ